MTKLIYHRIKGSPGNDSPFEATILEMTSSKTLKIACPYLSRKPLERILEDHTEWFLLTDIDALFRELGKAHRQWFVDLFRANSSRVRHNKNLHAKVVIGAQQALVGSANLTRMGLAERAEMSVLLLDQATIGELDSWFSDLWKECPQLTEEEFQELERFSSQLPASSSNERQTGILQIPPGPQCKANLTSADREEPTVQKSAAPSKKTPTGEPSTDPVAHAKDIVGEAKFAQLAKAPFNRRQKLIDTLTSHPSIEIKAEVDGRIQKFSIFKQAAAILHVLQRASSRKLTKKQIEQKLKPLGYSQLNINYYCWGLEGLGLLSIVKRGSTDYRSATDAGINVKLPSRDELSK